MSFAKGEEERKKCAVTVVGKGHRRRHIMNPDDEEIGESDREKVEKANRSRSRYSI